MGLLRGLGRLIGRWAGRLPELPEKIESSGMSKGKKDFFLIRAGHIESEKGGGGKGHIARALYLEHNGLWVDALSVWEGMCEYERAAEIARRLGLDRCRLEDLYGKRASWMLGYEEKGASKRELRKAAGYLEKAGNEIDSVELLGRASGYYERADDQAGAVRAADAMNELNESR
jgi:hypothetical protein